MEQAVRLEGSAQHRPQIVVAFVSALVMFMVLGWTVFYPRETFPYALLGIPLICLFTGILALSVWNGSRVGWAFNLIFWAGIARNSVQGLAAWEEDPFFAGSFASSFNYQLLRLSGAALLLVLLCWPSFVKWVWRREWTNPPTASNVTSATA